MVPAEGPSKQQLARRLARSRSVYPTPLLAIALGKTPTIASAFLLLITPPRSVPTNQPVTHQAFSGTPPHHTLAVSGGVEHTPFYNNGKTGGSAGLVGQ